MRLPFSLFRALVLIATLSVILLGAGCNVELPVADSGYVQSYRAVPGGAAAGRTNLSAGQIKSLTEWFAAHQSGWTYRIADVAATASIVLLRDGRVVAGAHLTDGQIWVGDKFRRLTSGEQTALEAILAAKDL